MPSRPWIVFTVALSIMLLTGCNLPLSSQSTSAPAAKTQTPVAPSKVPETQPVVVPTNLPDTPAPPTLIATPAAIDLLVAPGDVKTGVLPAGEYQKKAPGGFRKLLVYPVGGIDNMVACNNAPAAPVFQSAPQQMHAFSHDPAEISFETCGWKANEKVSITLTNPDGSQVRLSKAYDPSLALDYSIPMGYGMQLGDYSVTFESPSGKLTHDFKVVWPAGPGLVAKDIKQYFVYGFQPGEHVYVMAYQKSADALALSTWREMTVDQRGGLLLDDQFNDDLLAVVGDKSGLVWNNWVLGMFIGKALYYTQVAACSGAPTSRLQPFSFAYVTNGVPNNVRSAPSKSAKLVGMIKGNTVLVVQPDAPVCADGLLWWKIVERDEQGPGGWTAEGQGSDYWLAPLQ